MNKFVNGDKGRRRSKKAERRGKGMNGADVLDEGDNKARGGGSKSARRRDRDGEVQDFEISIGPDGQFKIM